MNRAPRRGWNLLALPYLPIVALLLVNLGIGLAIGNQYGESYDEPLDASFGRVSVKAYQGESPEWSWYGNRRYYGPAYFMAQNLAADGLVRILPGWLPSDARHLVTFLTFQLAIVAFYALARRFVAPWPALATAFLFSTQPLYFGHAFINQKDVPFLALFLCTVALGWCMADVLSGTQGGNWSSTRSWSELTSRLRQVWVAAPTRTRVWTVGLSALGAAVFLELFVTKVVVLPVIDSLIRSAYANQAWEPWNILFQAVAQHSGEVPVSAYIGKAHKLYLTGSVLGLVAWIGAILFIARQPVTQALREEWSRDPRLWPEKWLANKHMIVILVLAGSVAGLATSIRVFGAFAGLLVTLLVLARSGRRAVVPLSLYWVIAALATYATWPFLWSSPLANLVKTLQFMASHPWRGYVLYMGELTKGRLLPWHYLPALMTLQFTEPVMVLAAAGTVMGLLKLRRKRLPSIRWLLLMLWFGVPIGVEILRHAWLYDNFRQFLFVTPPIFIAGAYGLQALLGAARRPALQVALVVALLVPGVVGIIRLHPFQYVYFNAFVGGVGGAARNFELDYWCTSYRQAAESLNSVLPSGARLAVWGPAQLAMDFARSDIQIERYTDEQVLRESSAGLVLICGRANNDVRILQEAATIQEVGVCGAPLSSIKSLQPATGD